MDSPCLPSCGAASSASAAAPLTLMKWLFGRLISLPFVLINEAALARPWGSVKLSTGLTPERGAGPVLRGVGGGVGGVYMDKSSVTLATPLLSSTLVRMVRWHEGLSRRILLCVPLRSFFIRESLCKQLPSIDWEHAQRAVHFPDGTPDRTRPGNCSKRFRSVDRVLSLTEKLQNRGQEVQQAAVESTENVV